jgi:hypothetical protein
VFDSGIASPRRRPAQQPSIGIAIFFKANLVLLCASRARYYPDATRTPLVF